MNIIFIIGIFISLFQFVLLLNKKSKSLPDKLLALWMLIIGVHLLSYYLYYLGYWNKYPHLVGITVPFPFFYGPMLYLYVSYSLKNENFISKKDYLHFAPIVISYLYMSKFYFFYSVEEKRLVDMGELDDFDTFSNILLIAFIISGFSYSIFSYRLLNKYKLLINSNFSNTERVHLNWLKGFIWAVGAFFVIVAILILTKDLIGISYSFNPDFIIYSIIVFSILVLGYYGIRHQNIFTDNVAVDVTIMESYKKSGLKDDDAKLMFQHLLELMEQHKPFLEPKLSLTALANLLNISPNHLSQIINQFGQKNFNDFVNQYRVEEFIRRSSEKSHLSFLALALESGFNSKSTFNSVFKKHKGLTPSQFLASQPTQASA